LIDTGEAVARQLVRRLPNELAAAEQSEPDERFWTTGEVRAARRSVALLWGHRAAVEPL
jgi:hypothetical protein